MIMKINFLICYPKSERTTHQSLYPFLIISQAFFSYTIEYQYKISVKILLQLIKTKAIFLLH